MGIEPITQSNSAARNIGERRCCAGCARDAPQSVTGTVVVASVSGTSR